MASGNARPTRSAESFRNRAATSLPQQRATLLLQLDRLKKQKPVINDRYGDKGGAGIWR
jgi:hypothetical protein